MDGTIVCSLHRYRTKVDNGRELIDLQFWRENQHLPNPKNQQNNNQKIPNKGLFHNLFCN